jgi:hypothetical protein
MLGSALKGVGSKGAGYVLGFGTPQHIGKLFLTTYLFPFEIASIVLLVAAVGAVVLARRRRGLEGGREGEELTVRMTRPTWTGTLAEATGIRVGPAEETELTVGRRGEAPHSEGGW